MSLAAILAEQRRAAAAVIAEPGRGVRLWLADWVAEELLIMGEPMSVTKTAGDVYNEAWDECAAGLGWGPVSAVDRPAWAKECDEAAARAVIAWHEAERQKGVESSTYGDLVKACPLVAENIVNHEWDNLPIWQQRDWLMQQLAQRPAWPPMRPMAEAVMGVSVIVAVKAEQPWFDFAYKAEADFGGTVFEADGTFYKETELLGWWPLPEVPR